MKLRLTMQRSLRVFSYGIIALLIVLVVETGAAAYPTATDVNIQGSVWRWVPEKIVPVSGAGYYDYYPVYSLNADTGTFLMDTPFNSVSYIKKYFDLPSNGSSLSLTVWGARNINGWCGDPVTVTVSLIDSSNITHQLGSFIPVQLEGGVGPVETKKYNISNFAGQKAKIRIKQTSSGEHCTYGYYRDITSATSEIEFIALGKPVTVTTNGADEPHDHVGEWPSDITDGSLDYQPVSSGIEDGCVAWVNDDYNELMVVTVTIDLQGTYNINKIRHNMGNCQRAETWNADIMESPFGRAPTNPGTPHSGAWTEQTGDITTSSVTIKFEKTRTAWERDWLFIGEIEVWGTPSIEKKMVRPVEGWLVQRFDFDEDVGYKGHEGIDVDSNSDGKEVVAAADGAVVHVHRSITSGAGLWVWIWHGEVTALNGNVDENISTRYLHLKDIPEEIQLGTKVEGGKTVIGKVSNTGDGLWKWRFPPHLHFEERQGGNPEDIISGAITYKDMKALNPLRFVEYEDRSKKAKSLIISAHCPVELIVEDLDGLVVSKNVSEIPTASYFEIPLDEEGNPGYEFVSIDNRKHGKYSIEVVPEPDANLTDTYMLVVSTESTTTVLAENVSVSEIPTEPYVFESIIYFDTGTPANPYPSIFGTHNGTITPNQTISVHKLYTYPGPGTGGHTEYARIWNSTLDVNATWNGYTGDWHNISFNKSFMLAANETYNYTLLTGSYPQIIHESPFNATGGTITCDKFVDANGRAYYGWIPAIRLE